MEWGVDHVARGTRQGVTLWGARRSERQDGAERGVRLAAVTGLERADIEPGHFVAQPAGQLDRGGMAVDLQGVDRIDGQTGPAVDPADGVLDPPVAPGQAHELEQLFERLAVARQ